MHSIKGLAASFAAAALLFTLITPAALAQQMVVDDWAAVQSLTPSDEIVVTLKSGKETKGKFLDAGSSEISIERNGKRESVAKGTVAQVHLIKGKAKKGQWAAIGAGIGAGAGFGIGRSKSRWSDENLVYSFAGALIGTGIGATTGYFFGASRRNRVLIYQSR